MGPEWRHKCTPSAGGCHPIEVLLAGPSDSAWPAHLYDDNAHAVCGLPLSSGQTGESLRREIAAVLDPGAGTVLLFAADYRRTSSLYHFADSLLWRDAGALLATVALVAQALNLNCCALGFTGDILIKGLLDRDAFVGVGGCIVGSRLPDRSKCQHPSSRRNNPAGIISKYPKRGARAGPGNGLDRT